MIKFLEHPHWGYKPRTVENVSASDLTIAFATDFSSAGEMLTKRSCWEQDKKYIAINLSGRKWDEEQQEFIKVFEEGKVNTLNIAGNGIYTLKGVFTQSACDDFVYNFFKYIPGIDKLKLIRSGGQTGFDEAGLKAAVKLGIPALCLAPKGWKFRTEAGFDIQSEKLFKARFI